MQALSDWTFAAANSTTERDDLASALRQAELEAAQLRAERLQWQAARGLLETQLTDALNDVVVERRRTRDVLEDRTSSRAGLAGAPQEQELQLRAALAAAQSRVEASADAGERAQRDSTSARSAATRLDSRLQAPDCANDQATRLSHDATRLSVEDAVHAETTRRLTDERDQLTRVLHQVTGRCDAAEVEVRQLKAAARSGEERHERDTATIAGLRVECDSVKSTYEWTRARLDEIETAVAGERAAAAHESDLAREQLRRLRADLEAEQQRANALDGELAASKAAVERQSALLASLASDHSALQQLFTQILRGLGDADQQLRVLLERQQSALTR
jgi:hypothetical protein